MGTIRIRRPTAPPSAATSAPTYALQGDVRGKRAGIRTDRAWRSWQLIASVWRERLEGDGASVVDVETHGQVGQTGFDDRKHIEELAEAVDFAIVGLGTCGSCTSFAVADAVAIERHQRPVIAIVTDEFATHAHNMADHLGHRDLRVLVLPYPLEARPEAELRAIADEYYPHALALLEASP